MRLGHHIVPPAFGIPEGTIASVFAAARLDGPVTRDQIARSTSLSIASVNRSVTALLAAELLRERADLATAGAIGRPRVPVEVNRDNFVAVGVHIGARATKIVAVDLSGRTLDIADTPTPTGPQRSALAALTGSVARYIRRWHRRRPLWVGVAIGGVVDSAAGTVVHPRLGWTDAPVGPALAEAVGLPVSVGSHVDAMAAADLLLAQRRPTRSRSTSLYVYARETVGYAIVIDDRVHIPASGPGTIAGLPVRSELLPGGGKLESTVSDEAILDAARALEILPTAGHAPAGVKPGIPDLVRAARAGNQQAHQLLTERGRVLGGALALLRDLLNPDDLVVGGQAFTAYPEAMRSVESAFRSQSTLPPRDLRVTAFGDRVQEAGAGIVSLSALYADPIAAMRRTRRSTTSRPHLAVPDAAG